MRRVKRRYKEEPMSLEIKERPEGGAEYSLDGRRLRFVGDHEIKGYAGTDTVEFETTILVQFQSKPSEIKDNEPLVLELKRGKSGEKELWLDSQKLRNVKRFTVKCYGDRATADLKVKILVRLAEKLPDPGAGRGAI